MMMSFQSLGNLTLALKSSVLVSVRDKSSSYTPRLICCELCFHHIHWSLSSSLEPKLSRCSEIPISASLKCLNYATNTVSFLLLEYPSRMIKYYVKSNWTKLRRDAKLHWEWWTETWAPPHSPQSLQVVSWQIRGLIKSKSRLKISKVYQKLYW